MKYIVTICLNFSQIPTTEIIQNSYVPWYIWLIIVISILINIALGYLLFLYHKESIETNNMNDNLIQKLEISNTALAMSESAKSKLKNKYNKLKNQNTNLSSKEVKGELKINKEYFQNSDINKSKAISISDKNKKEKSIIKTNTPKYLPKQRGNGWSHLSENPNEETLFKLFEIDSNTYEFEVYKSLSDYILKDVVNHPDNTIYKCCERLNENTDFQSGILTEKKGKIVKEGDMYVLKEKAVIKFI